MGVAIQLVINQNKYMLLKLFSTEKKNIKIELSRYLFSLAEGAAQVCADLGTCKAHATTTAFAEHNVWYIDGNR